MIDSDRIEALERFLSIRYSEIEGEYKSTSELEQRVNTIERQLRSIRGTLT